jgi:hypothetical protein
MANVTPEFVLHATSIAVIFTASFKTADAAQVIDATVSEIL